MPTDYQRRTVEWFPKKGVDIVDAPKGALLRTWTINPESRTSGDHQVKKWWPIPLRDKKQFKAHLLGFRGIGIGIGNPWAKSEERSREGFKDYITPSVVLRLEDGRKRCFSRNSFSEADELTNDVRNIRADAPLLREVCGVGGVVGGETGSRIGRSTDRPNNGRFPQTPRNYPHPDARSLYP